MYTAYYHLKKNPFRLSPERDFCYRHSNFDECRAYLRDVLDSAQSCVLLTGFPGMGKTLLVNDLLADFSPSEYRLAQLVSTQLDAAEIVRSTANRFGLEEADSAAAALQEKLKQLLTQSHKEKHQPLLVVDEAQNLPLDALEELQRLAGTLIDGQPLLQIIFVSQSQSRNKHELSQLERQLRCPSIHLGPLTSEQTYAYIFHRLTTAGWSNNPEIKYSAITLVWLACQGVPRVINQFCSRLLLLGAMENKTVLDEKDARNVYQEMLKEDLYVAPLKEDSVGNWCIDEEVSDVIFEPQDASGQRESTGTERLNPSERKIPRFTISYDRADSVITLLMAVTSVVGFVALAIFR